MKHTITTSTDTQISASINVDAADLTKAKDLALKRLSKDVKVAGFRKGKVPHHVAEKHLDPNALANEVVENAVNISLNDIITAEQLQVLDKPNVEIKAFVPYTQLDYTVTIDILPKITLGDYKNLKIKRVAEPVKDADIDEVIERIKKNFADKNEVKRAAKNGDEVIIDFDGKDKEGKPLEGTKATDYTLALGSGSFIPGFEDQIVSHKAGETFDINVTFPDDYHAEHLKGADVTFTITLKKVFELTAAEVDDALAKKVGKFDTLAALKEDIKDNIKIEKEQEADEKFKDDLLGELVQKSTVPLSQVLIDDQMRAIEQEAKQNLLYRGMSVEQYLKAQGYKDEEEWREKEFKQAAVRRVQAGLVLAELTKAEKIQIDSSELEIELERRKAEAPKMAAEFDKPEVRRDVANRVMTQKTIQRLVDLNS